MIFYIGLFFLTRNCLQYNNQTFVFFYQFQVSKAYFAFYEIMFSNQIQVILNLDKSTFMHIVGSLESGLKGLDTSISTQVLIADCYLSFYEMKIWSYVWRLGTTLVANASLLVLQEVGVQTPDTRAWNICNCFWSVSLISIILL